MYNPACATYTKPEILNRKEVIMDAFLGQIAIFPYAKTPKDWAQCNGQILDIKGNEALFSLLGTFYGGNGTSTFALPDLRGRVPAANVYVRGNPGLSYGAETVTLTADTAPAHTHMVYADATAGDQVLGQEHHIAGTNDQMPLYAPDSFTPLTTLDPDTIGNTGGGQAHSNMQPFLALNFCICTKGYYPPRP